MRKLLFFVVFFLLTGTNSAVVSFAYSTIDDQAIDMPLGDGEENPEESSKSSFEEDDDEVVLDHRWMSKVKSVNTSLHFLYQEVVFQSLELEVVIPPPKA
jgi:hypothetical protein